MTRPVSWWFIMLVSSSLTSIGGDALGRLFCSVIWTIERAAAQFKMVVDFSARSFIL